jgi:hypothetical protein
MSFKEIVLLISKNKTKTTAFESSPVFISRFFKKMRGYKQGLDGNNHENYKYIMVWNFTRTEDDGDWP